VNVSARDIHSGRVKEVLTVDDHGAIRTTISTTRTWCAGRNDSIVAREPAIRLDQCPSQVKDLGRILEFLIKQTQGFEGLAKPAYALSYVLSMDVERHFLHDSGGDVRAHDDLPDPLVVAWSERGNALEFDLVVEFKEL
jgi:hypothetical protein